MREKFFKFMKNFGLFAVGYGWIIVLILFLLFKPKEPPKEYKYINFNGSQYIKKDTTSIDSSIRSKINDLVVFNVETSIYHEPWCEWAEQCVDNCIYMERREAQKYGRHCYVCTGNPDGNNNNNDDRDHIEGLPDRFQ